MGNGKFPKCGCGHIIILIEHIPCSIHIPFHIPFHSAFPFYILSIETSATANKTTTSQTVGSCTPIAKFNKHAHTYIVCICTCTYICRTMVHTCIILTLRALILLIKLIMDSRHWPYFHPVLSTAYIILYLIMLYTFCMCAHKPEPEEAMQTRYRYMDSCIYTLWYQITQHKSDHCYQ